MTRTSTSPTNREILQDELDGYPDSLDDLDDVEIISAFTHLPVKLSRAFDNFQVLPDGWANSNTLAQLVHSIQFHPSLPAYDGSSSSLNDVYLVSVPHRDWPVSTGHWSFYSQGQFLHLRNKSSPELGIERMSLGEVERDMADIRREVDSHTFHLTSDKSKKSMRLPLMVYNVGQTRFDAEQMEKLARYIISQCKTYTLWHTNCHLFVLSLLHRTVMAKRDGTIFVGTKSQIIRWDRCLKNDTTTGAPSPYNQHDGFCLSRSAEHELSDRSTHYFLNLSGLISDSFVVRRSRAIAKLYRSGEGSVGSYDPSGASSQSTYAAKQISRDVKKISQDFSRLSTELLQDVRRGRFLDVVRGRKESNLKTYEELVWEAKKGAQSAEKLLPLHKFLLSISDAEEKEIRERVYGGDVPRATP